VSSSTSANGTMVFDLNTSQGAADFLHAWYCANQTQMLRDTCENTPLTAAQKRAFRTLYTDWVSDIQDAYRLMVIGNVTIDNDLDSDMDNGLDVDDVNDMTMDDDKWMNSSNDWWMTEDDERIMIRNNQLMRSTNNGVKWSAVPHWTWQAADGMWYRFDTNWNLSVSKNGGVTWMMSDDDMWPGDNGMWYRLQANGNLEMRDGKSTVNGTKGLRYDPSQRREDDLSDYEACKDVSPRRYSTCLDQRAQAREDRLATLRN